MGTEITGFNQRLLSKRLLMDHDLIQSKIKKTLPSWLKYASLSSNIDNLIEVVYYDDPNLVGTEVFSFELSTLITPIGIGKVRDVKKPREIEYFDRDIVQYLLLNLRAADDDSVQFPPIWHTCLRENTIEMWSKGKFDCPRLVLDAANNPILYFCNLPEPPKSVERSGEPYRRIGYNGNYLLQVINPANFIYYLVIPVAEYNDALLRVQDRIQRGDIIVGVEKAPSFVDEYQMAFSKHGDYSL